MAETREKCAHPICTCLAREDNKYCSPYCEDAKDTTEIACNCGHTTCEATDARVRTPTKVEEPAA